MLLLPEQGNLDCNTKQLCVAMRFTLFSKVKAMEPFFMNVCANRVTSYYAAIESLLHL